MALSTWLSDIFPHQWMVHGETSNATTLALSIHISLLQCPSVTLMVPSSSKLQNSLPLQMPALSMLSVGLCQEVWSLVNLFVSSAKISPSTMKKILVSPQSNPHTSPALDTTFQARASQLEISFSSLASRTASSRLPQ